MHWLHKDKNVGSNPAATRNEKTDIGQTPAQKVPQKSGRISVEDRRCKAELDAKLWRRGSKPTPGPNANGFVSQWIIGYKFQNKNINFGIFITLICILFMIIQN